MNFQGEILIIEISKSGQSANDLIFQPRISTVLHNGGGCIFGGRLKLLPYPTLTRNESTKKFDYQPARPTEMHPVLAHVFYFLSNSLKEFNIVQ